MSSIKQVEDILDKLSDNVGSDISYVGKNYTIAMLRADLKRLKSDLEDDEAGIRELLELSYD